MAQNAIEPCSNFFKQFGITILDIQILNYTCVNPETQKLLDKDIYTNVTKQNELRAAQNDVTIQESINAVNLKQKDLQVLMNIKDNEVLLQKQTLENQLKIRSMETEIAVNLKQKDLQVQMNIKDSEVQLQKKTLENQIRMKEMEIEIQEQVKRKDLLEVRRGNDLLEAEFEGKSRGEEFKEFLKGLDVGLTPEQKISIWMRQMVWIF